MDLSVFFQSGDPELVANLTGSRLGSRAFSAGHPFPDWKQARIVLLGVPSLDMPMGMTNAIRKKLYQLSLPHPDLALADLGDLKPKDNLEAYFDALAYVMDFLLKEDKIIILLADDPTAIFGQYMAYERLGDELEYVHVDSRFQLGDPDTALGYNRRIFTHEPNYLFSYTNLGYQQYLVSEEEISSVKGMNFFAVRYGELEGQIEEAEPFFRDAGMSAFDFSSVRHSDFAAGLVPSPGGFSVNEICRLGRYAGIGNAMKSISVTGLDPTRDASGMSSQAAAIFLWYVMEGIYNRRPEKDKSTLRKYSVQLHASVDEISFFENPISQQWWMEVPFQSSLGKSNPKTRLVPCLKKDYETARKDEIPDRWWSVFNKSNS